MSSLPDGVRSGKNFLKSHTLADNGDIAWQILLQLPMKQLFCCKSVCKAWNSIISNPYFCSEYCRRLPADGGFLCFGKLESYNDYGSNRIPVSYFPANSDRTTKKEFLSVFDSRSSRCPKNAFVIASSGGLLLCMRRSSLDPNHMKMCYYICCPLTKEWLIIAQPPNSNQYSIDGFISHEEGSEHHSYEIIRIPTGNNFRCSVSEIDFLHIESYSSRTCQWSTDRLPLPSGLQNIPDPGEAAVFAQGVFNWLVNKGLDIMSYNPSSRQLEVLPLPPYDPFHCIITVRIGTLRSGALCCCRWEARELYLEVWAFDRCNDSTSKGLEPPWLSIYPVHLYEMCKGEDLFIYDVLISEFLDALVIVAEIERSCVEVIEYGLSSKKLKTICIRDGSYSHDMKYCNYQKSKWPR